MEKEKMQCSLTEVTLSSEPCKMILHGCITLIGKPSTGAPCGANGKQVVFTKESIDSCAQGFVGMPLNCVYPEWFNVDDNMIFTDHGTTNIGYIRDIKAVDDKLMADIVVWKDKFPQEAFMITNGAEALGFSVEWYTTEKHIDDDYYYVDEFEARGCAILWKECAAFSDTFIETLAAAKAKRSDANMNKEEKDTLVKEITDSVMASIEQRFKSIEDARVDAAAKLGELQAAREKSVEEVKNFIDEIKAAQEEVKSSIEKHDGEISVMKAAVEKREQMAAAHESAPAPKTGQHVEGNPLSGADEKAKKLDEIKASDMSLQEKIKAITKIRLEND